MSDFTFHIAINQRNYFDHTVEADDLEAAKQKLVEDMAEGTQLHVYDVTTGGTKTELCEDIELPDENYYRKYQERDLLAPFIEALQDIIASSDSNCGGSLANAIQTAKTLVAKKETTS